MKRKILLVDDEVAILLTLKAVLEISGFSVETAASAREAKLKLKKNSYAMVITDMKMEKEEAGRDVIRAARSADYHPAIALLTAFPVAEEDWQEMGADKMLVKPMQIQVLLGQIEALLASHEEKLRRHNDEPVQLAARAVVPEKRATGKKADGRSGAARKTAGRKKKNETVSVS